MPVSPIQKQAVIPAFSSESLIKKMDIDKIIFLAKLIIDEIADHVKIGTSLILFTGNIKLIRGAPPEYERIPIEPNEIINKDQFAKNLLPIVTNRILNAFSKPKDFLQKGLNIEVIGQNGLMGQRGKYLDGISKRKLNEMSFKFGYKVSCYSVTLQLDEKKQFILTDHYHSHSNREDPRGCGPRT